jgi:uncharacterized protein RhaS with RHS repeats
LSQASWLVLVAFLFTTAQEATAWYSPSQQRWINRDPLGEEVGANLYRFVLNNPVKRYDPIGLFEDGHNGAGTNGCFKGHSDSYGHNCFDFTLEDHDPRSAPVPGGNPAAHFQDFVQSERQVKDAIARCNAEAFARAMHRLQDYFTHRAKGYRYDPPVHCRGHLGVSPSPDLDNQAWDKANKWTKKYVDQYIKACGLPNDHIPIEGTE